MGLFKDLGFKNRNGMISVPSAAKVGGMTAQDILYSRHKYIKQNYKGNQYQTKYR